MRVNSEASPVNCIRVGDIEVTYQLDGPVDAPIVMLVHGLMTSHRIWDGVVRSLSQKWRILRYDLRGHGGTTGTSREYSMDLLAGDAIELMNALQISRAHFIGLSLGGMLAQYLGAHHSARFSSLTLANTTCEQLQKDAWQQRIEIAAVRGVGPLVSGTLPRWFTPRVFVERRDLVAEAEVVARGTSVDGFIGCASVVRDLSQRDLLAGIDVPTLVIAGELDQATTVEEANVLVESIQGARLQTIEAAHQSAMECPDAFVRAWTQFQHDINLEQGLA